MPFGIYLHVPFCLQKCPYCDFYSTAIDPQTADRYLAAMLRAITFFSGHYAHNKVDSVYFGGGTPSLLGAKRLLCILEHVSRNFDISSKAEITVEVNPASGIKSELQALRSSGVNRLSFGVQSLRKSELELLGRPHSAKEAVKAILDAADSGFEHISADLMLALPGQTVGHMSESIAGFVALPLDHISAYLLKIEDGTPFAQKNFALPNEDETAEQYLACIELLEKAGFMQYEISNFARPGGEARHNLKYWHCEEYLGIGPAAHSFMGGQRFYFPADLQGFIQTGNFSKLIVQDGEGGSLEEYCMLNLRLRDGLDLQKLAELYPNADITGMLKRALRLKDFVILEDERIYLTPKGFLLSNSVIAEICL